MQHLNKMARSVIVAVALVGSMTLAGCGDDDNNLLDVNAGNVNNQQFTFADGAAIDSRLAARTTTIAFTNNGARTTITSGANSAAGTNTFGSCIISIQTSDFPATGATAGPQVGDTITLNPCQVNTDNNSLQITNAATGTAGSSNSGTGTTGG